MWKHSILACLLGVFALAQTAEATTIRVAKSGVRDWDTVTSGVAAAQTGDTVEIGSGTYTESVSILNKTTLTLTVAPGADVTIAAPASLRALYVQNCKGLTIKGESATNKLKVLANTNFAMQGVWSLTPNLLVQDVEFLGTSNTYTVECGSSAGQPITFNRCRFKVDGKWATVKVTGSAKATFNDCKWDQGDGTMNAVRFTGGLPGFVKLNRCDVIGKSGDGEFRMSAWPAFFFEGTTTATIEAEDCRFGNYYYIYDDNDYAAATPVNANKTVRLINPIMLNSTGVSIGNIFQTCTGVNCIVQGKNPVEKADLRKSMTLFSMAVVKNGTVTFQDCIMNKAAWANYAVMMDSTSNAPRNVNFDRCLFPGKGGVTTTGDTVGTGEATINFTNSLMEASADGLIPLVNTTKASKESINMTHCTLYPGLSSFGVDMMAGSTNDVLTAQYSIFDGFDENSIHHDVKLNGSHNLVQNATVFNFGGTAPIQPADTIVADPKLEYLNGHLLSGSPAIGAATGSTMAIDIDGNARPTDGTTDLGADEYSGTVTNAWASITANKTAVPPTLDGVLSANEWSSSSVVMNHYTMVLYGGTSTITPGSLYDQDLSASFRFSWDANYLYVAAQVLDDSVDTSGTLGAALNASDCIQLGFDPAYSRTPGISDGVFRFDFAPGLLSAPNTAASYQHYPESTPNTFANTSVASSRVAGGYVIEARIKWSDVTPTPITPAAGTSIGYLAGLVDYDGAAIKDLWMNAGSGTDVMTSPDKWNTMILVEPPVNSAKPGWAIYE